MNKFLRMFRFVSAYKWRLFFFFYTAIGFSAFTGLSVIMLHRVTKAVIERAPWTVWKSVLLAVAGAWLLRVYFTIRRLIAEQYLMNVAVRDATNRVMAHLLRRPPAFFDRWRSGELMSRISHDAAALSRAVMLFTAFVREPLSIVAALGALLYIHWQLTFVAVVGFPLAAWPVVMLSRRIRRSSRRERESAADRSDAMVQTFGAIKVVKAFRREELQTRHFEETNAAIFGHAMGRARAYASMRGVLELVGASGLILAILVGVALLLRDTITPDRFLAFFYALPVLYQATRTLGQANAQVQEALPGAERLFELLDVKEALSVPADAVPVGRLREAVRFRDVSFSYGREAVLHGVSLEAKAGSVTAIVGPSGAGKSTIVNLMARFYDPDEGVVEIDGVDLRRIQPASWLDQTGLVTQDPVLFNVSIRDNIRYGRLDATDDEIEEAARTANIHDDIMRLPEGYDTLAGERGAQLSGGQRQRVCIARALVRNPAVLLLDEATSSLDSASEKIVQQAIERAQRGRTSVVVAHRLSTVLGADRIYVFVEGRVEASGRHEELLEKSPTYRQLWEIQQGKAAT